MLVYLSIFGALAAGSLYIGTDGDDTIHGTEGDDRIDGADGDDEIHGELGFDELFGGLGDDTVDGGAGDDRIFDQGGTNLLEGGAGNDTILDYDVLAPDSLSQTSTLSGGDGNDLLIKEGKGFSSLVGGDGDDILTSEFGGDYTGGAGADYFVPDTEPEISTNYASHIRDFTPGEDLVVMRLLPGQTPEDLVITDNTGAAFDDDVVQLQLGAQGTTIFVHGMTSQEFGIENIAFLDDGDAEPFVFSQGANGPDTSLLASHEGGGDDTTNGGEDDTNVSDPDAITGTSGDDVLWGTFGDDSVVGLGGNDRLIGDDGTDTLVGGAGIDTMYGGDGDDVLLDTQDKGELIGNAGDDLLITSPEGAYQPNLGTLYGSRVDGGDGNDTIVSRGLDGLTGGAGADDFIVDTSALTFNQGNRPEIEDFEPGVDEIVVALPDDDASYNIVVDTLNGLAVVYLEDETGERDRFVQVNTGSVEEVENAVRVVSRADFDEIIGAASGGDTGDGGNDDGDGITGTEGDDRIIGTYEDDEILGFGGNDFLAGDDGSDTIDADAGRDTVYAGDGNDLIRSEGAENELFGNDGDDILWATEGGTVAGGAGADYFVAADGVTVVTDFDVAEDTLVIPRPADDETFNLRITRTVSGGDLVVLIDGVQSMRLEGTGSVSGDQMSIAVLDQSEFETFLNSQGADGPALPATLVPIEAPAGNNPVIGTNGGDLIEGTDARETFDGMAGNDTVIGGGTGGAPGGDWIEGNDGDDLLYLGGRDADGNPIVSATQPGTGGFADGGAGNDTIYAGSNDDILYGGAGNDVIIADPTATARGQVGDDFIAVTTQFGTPEGSGPGWAGAGDGQDTIAILDGFDDDYVVQLDDGADAVVLNTEGNANLDVQAFDASIDVLAVAYPDGMPAPTSADLSYDTATGPTVLNLTQADGSVVPLASFNGLNTLPDLTDIVFVPEGSIAPGMTFDAPVPTSPTEDADLITGTDGPDTIDGLGGNDTINGAAGADWLIGGDGNDNLFAGDEIAPGTIDRAATGVYPPLGVSNVDTVEGGDGNDTLSSGIGNVRLDGGAGDDLILGGTDGHQDLNGDQGNDTILAGQALTQTVNVGTVVNPFTLGSSADGGPGNDVLVSGDGYGPNPFYSGFGASGYFGGQGADTFIETPGGDDMWIRDFNPIEDQIVLTVPDGTVLPDDGAVEFRVNQQVVEPRYLIMRAMLEISVLDADGTRLATAEVNWSTPSYYPNIPQYVTIANPFAEGVVSVMTESEMAQTFLGETPAPVPQFPGNTA